MSDIKLVANDDGVDVTFDERYYALTKSVVIVIYSNFLCWKLALNYFLFLEAIEMKSARLAMVPTLFVASNTDARQWILPPTFPNFF